MCMFCRSLFVLLLFLFWTLCCLHGHLQFTDSETPLVSSNFSSRRFFFFAYSYPLLFYSDVFAFTVYRSGNQKIKQKAKKKIKKRKHPIFHPKIIQDFSTEQHKRNLALVPGTAYVNIWT